MPVDVKLSSALRSGLTRPSAITRWPEKLPPLPGAAAVGVGLTGVGCAVVQPARARLATTRTRIEIKDVRFIVFA